MRKQNASMRKTLYCSAQCQCSQSLRAVWSVPRHGALELSSGIINFQRPRFQEFRFHSICMLWFIWRPQMKSMWMCSTEVFNTHWKNQESRNLALKEQQYQILLAKDTRALGTSFVDYSRAPCLGADQKAHGLWERDWLNANNIRLLTKCDAALLSFRYTSNILQKFILFTFQSLI